MKNIKVSSLCYEMILEIAKKNRMKPEQYIEQLVQSEYSKRKQ